MPFIVQKIAGQQSLIAFVAGERLRIGRGTNAELRFDDVAVGLEHAVIEATAGGYRLLDRGSVTGTYLNGKAVREARLAANDLIHVGGYQIRVQITDPEDPLFLSVRASGAMQPPPEGTTRMSPDALAAAVRAAAAAAGQPAPAQVEAAQATAAEAAGPPPGPLPGPPAALPTGPPAWEAASAEGAIVADAATMRMSPEALATAVRAAARAAAAAGEVAAWETAASDLAASEAAARETAARDLAASEAAAREAATREAAAREASPAPAPGVASPAAGAPRPPSAPPAAGAPRPPSAPPAAGAPRPPTAPPPSMPPPSAPPPGAPPLRVPAVDYLRAYSLRRPFFNKGLLALGLTLGAAALLLALPLTGRTRAFEPGRVHAWHSDTSCASCHSPWRGPDPALCSDCHARQREKGQVHQARQTFTPPCTGCHPEHRGGERPVVGDQSCVSCHGDLQVSPPGAEPRFARHIAGFAGDHPDFSVTLPGGARLPLAEAVARRADPTPLRFSHQQHLRAGLPTPSGQRVQLSCQSCHRLPAGSRQAAPGAQPAASGGQSAPGGGQNEAAGTQSAVGQTPPAGGATGIVPVSYDLSCTTSGCHLLTFDSLRPGLVAPHAAPRRVSEFLIAVYSNRRGANESVRDQYRRLIRGAGQQSRAIDYSGQAQGAEVLAEHYFFDTACKECHFIDPDTRPLPTVTWQPIPERWLPNARFSHLDHQASDCQLCHAAAAASKVAADVLLPSIEVCRACHGRGAPAAAAPGPAVPAANPAPSSPAGTANPETAAAPATLPGPAPTDCLSCHRYHPDTAPGLDVAGQLQ